MRVMRAGVVRLASATALRLWPRAAAEGLEIVSPETLLGAARAAHEPR